MPPETPIEDLVEQAEPEAGVSPEADVSLEVTVAPEPVEQLSEPAVDMAEVDGMRASILALTAERDVALGRAAMAESQVAPLQAEVASLQAKLADYELGAALSSAGLPAQAGPMVRSLYANSLATGRAQPIAQWLTGYLGTPEGAALSLLKGQPRTDPRSLAVPVNGAASPGLQSLPSFLRNR